MTGQQGQVPIVTRGGHERWPDALPGPRTAPRFHATARCLEKAAGGPVAPALPRRGTSPPRRAGGGRRAPRAGCRPRRRSGAAPCPRGPRLPAACGAGPPGLAPRPPALPARGATASCLFRLFLKLTARISLISLKCANPPRVYFTTFHRRNPIPSLAGLVYAATAHLSPTSLGAGRALGDAPGSPHGGRGEGCTPLGLGAPPEPWEGHFTCPLGRPPRGGQGGGHSPRGALVVDRAPPGLNVPAPCAGGHTPVGPSWRAEPLDQTHVPAAVGAAFQPGRLTGRTCVPGSGHRPRGLGRAPGDGAGAAGGGNTWGCSEGTHDPRGTGPCPWACEPPGNHRCREMGHFCCVTSIVKKQETAARVSEGRIVTRAARAGVQQPMSAPTSRPPSAGGLPGQGKQQTRA